MKRLCTIGLLAILTIQLVGCASPEERKRRDAQWAREDAQRDHEYARRDAEDYDDFLVRYARSLGKRVSELTADERADARREYNYGGHHSSLRHHFWY